LSRGFDHVLFDAPPAIGQITLSILKVSDLAIIPIGPSALDIWSSRETVSLLDEARKRSPRIRGKLLICRKIPGTKLAREAREALDVYDLSVFRTEIAQRIAYVEAMISGVSVLMYAPKSKAAEEVRDLCKEVLGEMRRKK
jgi:chromosome partitioning protein